MLWHDIDRIYCFISWFLFFRFNLPRINWGKARKLCKLSDVNWGRTAKYCAINSFIILQRPATKYGLCDWVRHLRPDSISRRAAYFNRLRVYRLPTQKFRFADELKQRVEFAVLWKSDSEVNRVHSSANYTKRSGKRDTIVNNRATRRSCRIRLFKKS